MVLSNGRESTNASHPLSLSEDSEREVLEEIRVYEVAIASVDAELQELFRQAAVLRSKKQRYLDLIGKCRGRITLALRAPDELLANIFEHCASDWAKAPLILSQVCRKWRQAAMSPAVWSRVSLTSESRDSISKSNQHAPYRANRRTLHRHTVAWGIYDSRFAALRYGMGSYRSTRHASILYMIAYGHFQ